MRFPGAAEFYFSTFLFLSKFLKTRENPGPHRSRQISARKAYQRNISCTYLYLIDNGFTRFVLLSFDDLQEFHSSDNYLLGREYIRRRAVRIHQNLLDA